MQKCRTGVKRVVYAASSSVFGDGEAARDFCAVQNIVKANILSAFGTEAAGEIFNADIKKAREVPGFRPAVYLKEGL